MSLCSYTFFLGFYIKNTSRDSPKVSTIGPESISIRRTTYGGAIFITLKPLSSVLKNETFFWGNSDQLSHSGGVIRIAKIM